MTGLVNVLMPASVPVMPAATLPRTVSCPGQEVWHQRPTRQLARRCVTSLLARLQQRMGECADCGNERAFAVALQQHSANFHAASLGSSRARGAIEHSSFDCVLPSRVRTMYIQ